MTAGPCQRKLFALATEIGLTDTDRHDLAEMVLRRDCQSWATLTDPEIGRLLDALTGYGLVRHLLETRRPTCDPMAVHYQAA